MSMFWHELRAYRKATIIWVFCIVLLLTVSMVKYTTLSMDGGAGVKQLLDGFPATVQAVFGMNGLDITTIMGYFGMLFLYVAIMLSIHAGLLGADIIAKEEQDKTTEFLYVKPRSRSRVLTAKLLAALVLVVIMNGVTFATYCTLASRYVALHTVLRELVLFNVAYLVLQLLFMAIGMVAAASAWSKRASKIVAALVLVAYFLYVVASIQPALGGVGGMSPFAQLEAKSIIATKSLATSWVIGYAALATGCVVLAYQLYRRRDLRL